jgi:hypothetical protein
MLFFAAESERMSRSKLITLLSFLVLTLVLAYSGTAKEEDEPEAAPADEAPAEETPAEETPAEETPAEETPAEEAPAEEAPAEEAPAEEAPAEEAPAEEAPAEEPPAPPPVVDTWVDGAGVIVLDDYEQTVRRGKRGAASEMDVVFSFRSTSDRPIFQWRGDIAWSGYYGVRLYVKPYHHGVEMGPGQPLTIEGTYPDTGSASSLYTVLAPMKRKDFEVTLENVEVMYELPAVVEEVIDLPSPEEVITAEALDRKFGRNGDIIKCFVDAINAGTQFPPALHVGFTVHSDGHLSDGGLVEEEYQGTTLDQCLHEQVDLLSFEPFAAEEPIRLKYPFRFQ